MEAKNEKAYGQNVCINAKIAIDSNGKMKEVALSYPGKTLCNNAWIDVVPRSQLSAICKKECDECKKAGRVYRHVFKNRTPRVVSPEQIAKMQAGKQRKQLSLF